MTKAYSVVRVSVDEEERYPAYLNASLAALEKFDAKFLVRGGTYESMKGKGRDHNVAVEYRDYEMAVACYPHPKYQAAQKIRASIAETDFIVVEGIAA